MRFSDAFRYFVSVASACGVLKANDLIASPAFVFFNAGGEYHKKTTRSNQL